MTIKKIFNNHNLINKLKKITPFKKKIRNKHFLNNLIQIKTNYKIIEKNQDQFKIKCNKLKKMVDLDKYLYSNLINDL